MFPLAHPTLCRARLDRAGRRVKPERRTRVATRLQSWWHGVDLDLLLAAGVDPSSTDELRLRAAQVTKRRALRRAATALDTAVETADSPRVAAAHVLAVDGETIRQARPALLGLTLRLRDDDAVGPRAGAMVSYLVGSGDSPLHARSAGRRLRNFAHDASELIDAERQRRRALRTL
jgi:hypothetical protein